VTQRVDQLFGQGPRSESRARLVTGLLMAAIPLSLVGVLTCASLPAAGLALYAHLVAVSEVRRVSTGDLDIDELPRLTRLRRVAFWTMVVCGLSFVLQLVLLSNGFYEQWLPA
jgi:hypothetical protein